MIRSIQQWKNWGMAARGAGVAALLWCAAAAQAAPFVEYIIRGAPTIDHPAAGQTEFVLDTSGEKAALGSNDVNGIKLGQLGRVSIDRLDDVSRFVAGSGPAVGPYLNFWITDGTHYAVVANEPSDPGFQPLFDKGYDLSFADLSDKVAKIYENSDKSWLPNNGIGLTFADLSEFIIQAPSVALLDAGWTGLGSGAPRELGTNIAYGVNWVFGDTLANYVSGQPGYLVANAAVSAAAEVPEPSTLALVGLAALGLGAARKRVRA